MREADYSNFERIQTKLKKVWIFKIKCNNYVQYFNLTESALSLTKCLTTFQFVPTLKTFFFFKMYDSRGSFLFKDQYILSCAPREKAHRRKKQKFVIVLNTTKGRVVCEYVTIQWLNCEIAVDSVLVISYILWIFMNFLLLVKSI